LNFTDYEPNNYISGGVAPASNNYPQQYPEPLEPIIEIIIQDNNETLPPPETYVAGKKKKEQVQVFYVKYQKDEKSGLIIHDPIPALSPLGLNQDEDYEEEPEKVQIVTPLPPQRSTTLRTIIRPDSMQYESDSGVHVTFGSAHNHNSKSDNRIHDEAKLESAIRPVIQLPQNRAGPIASPLKEKRAPQTQGRIVNGASANFHHQPQALAQGPPNQRPHLDFNPQNNFVSQPNQGQLSHQLALPSQENSKPFHPNVQLQPQRPVPIPVHHQQQTQFNQQQQQNVLGHQQFNQPPQRLPQPQPQQQTAFRPPPPQRQPAIQNFNQNQKPFNYHAHQQQQQQQGGQVRFPNQPAPPQQSFQGQQQNFPPNFPPPQNLQRPQGHQIPPRQNSPQNFHNQNQQLPPVNRPIQQQFQNNQQFPPNQGPPPNFRPNQEHSAPQHLVQPLHQHNQAVHQNQQLIQNTNQNVFPGGLTVQPAPNLAGSHQQRPQFVQQPQPQQTFQDDSAFRQQQNSFIQNSFGSDVQVQSSVPKFEHHITETIQSPVFFQPTAIDMERLQQEKNGNIGPLSDNIGHLSVGQQQSRPESQHRFAVNQQQSQQQHHQHGGVSNHFSEVFPQIENHQKQFAPQNSFLELNGRNNFAPEPRVQATTAAPATTTRKVATTTTPRPAPSTTKKPATYDLPDEVPDDLRQQLLASGILDNAQISILDYDKIGETSLQDLPQEHLANFFSAGGGAQIGASNKVISVLKPNGDSIDEKIRTLKNDKEVTKILENAKKHPGKKDDGSMKVVKFDSQSQKNLQQSAVNQNNYNRYLPLKINGAQFPVPDVEELQGKIISSVVVLAPVNGNEDDANSEKETIETKQIKFISGDSLKNLLRKPSTDNFKKWLEKEQKTNPDLQSVVLLVTK
jgi:kinesin family member 13